ncbi:asparagine synthase C-terminal domain-containing protein [Caulobacter segnis]|uniref:asparagine synthase C-terminal domain-containing protein n=1 Tax=Caulobacter segnis TaxID=88688 RepID=UPI002855B98F|nr:asparagine synthase C-terminal domain-containing protein [Caulobacter segnis]MDR6624481.1 asparagine synthase (glutamine-hydrolyzing) [Caulobacter segnis]
MDGFLLDARFGFLGARPADDDLSLEVQGWRQARSAGTTTLWIRGDLQVRDLAGGWVVGELFERGTGRPAAIAPDALQSPDLGIQGQCERLARGFWGRYVAVFPADRAVFRDPSGHLDALVWHSPTAWIVGSDLPDDLPASALPRTLEIDWATIADMLGDENAMGGRLALRGLEALRPGALRTFTNTPIDRVVWDPSAFAVDPHPSYEASRRAVLAAVDESLMAESASGEVLLAEISGGLDSAIVASTLVKLGAGERTRFVHYHIDDPGGDERRFAHAVAERIGVPLMKIVKPELRIDEAALRDMPVGARASNNALDRHYDQSQVDLVRALGARRILTGQGGDMVFYESPSEKIGTEVWGRWARRPGADPAWRQMEDAARWNRGSTWSLIGEAVRETFRRPRRDLGQHPWLDRPVAPAKRRQISNLIHLQPLFNGASRRGREAQLVHPLLNQPVLEATLAAPVIDLARGGRGRSLARDAFEDRIPELVRARRSKGDLTAYYGRMVLRSLPTLRPFLLEGRLAAQGVLDVKGLEEGLDPDRMIHAGNYPRLYEIIAIEAFVRYWEGRAASALASGARGGEPRRSASQGKTSP